MRLIHLALALAASTLSNALKVGSPGHVNSNMDSNNLANIKDCKFVDKTKGTPTCQQFAADNSMSVNGLRSLNPWLDCSNVLADSLCLQTVCTSALPRRQPRRQRVLLAPTVFRPNRAAPIAPSSSVAAPVVASSSATASASVDASPAPTPSPAACVATTTCAADQCGQTITDNCGAPLACPACPCVASTSCADSQCGTTITDNCGNPLTCPACPKPASAPVGVDQSECIALFNGARQQYFPAAGGLAFSQRLASQAQPAADYNAGSGCCDASCHILSGPGTDIAQVLFCSKTTCASAYQGWVTDEAPYRGGHWAIIVGNPVSYRYVGCAVSGLNGQAIVCNFSMNP
ncbi:hypothetical protein BDR26DRAFT_351931 [Obelidium mucronatum]|nr:hypothetical protein BDR26DRAFT_351931 [Obelidium mucronatum]